MPIFLQIHFDSYQIRQKNLCRNNRVIDETFEEIDSFSKSKIVFEIFKQDIRASRAKFDVPIFVKVR